MCEQDMERSMKVLKNAAEAMIVAQKGITNATDGDTEEHNRETSGKPKKPRNPKAVTPKILKKVLGGRAKSSLEKPTAKRQRKR